MNQIENKAKEIINDLILLDPELKKIEAELNRLVIDFINNKPTVNITEEFEQDLKIKLIEKARLLKEEYNAKKIVFDKRIFIRKLSISLGAIALAVIIIFPVINLLKGNYSLFNNNKQVKITKLENEAFGNLAIKTSSNNNRAKGLMQASPANLATDSMSLTEIKTLNYNENPNFKYVYEGQDLTQIIPTAEKINVYSRSKYNYNNPSLLKSIVSSFSNSINLKKLNNDETKITHLIISEDSDFGYDINLDLNRGNLFLTQNRLKWPQVNNYCQDEECYLANQFKYEDLLSNEELIEIAQNFLDQFGINRDNYAKAVINYDFQEVYKNSKNKKDLYIPEETIITFPFLIDGKEVLDESANPYGLIVSVNSRYKKVTEVSNLYFNNFESSAYSALTDTNVIKKLAEQGGFNTYQEPSKTNEIIVKLGTPSFILSKQDKTNDGYENSEELFVPALSFPVLELSEKTDLFTQKYIVIPLVKELIDDEKE